MARGAEGLDIALVGTGVAGLSAAWLLSQAHRITVYEKAARIGGHINTVAVRSPRGVLPVDMGFIVYNDVTYPNLSALFRHLGVPTRESDMSFAVSLDGGEMEYAGTDLFGLFAQRRNLLRPRFWSMLRDLLRFYRTAPGDAAGLAPGHSLGVYLARNGYGAAFIEDHLLPMAAAVWSTPMARIADYPAASFIRFCSNHGLLQVSNRPRWRTVIGGSRVYADRLVARFADRVQLRRGVRSIERTPDAVLVRDETGRQTRHDHVVIATHSDEALALLTDPSRRESSVLGALRYGRNTAVMHTDASLMPRRTAVWSSWNYVGTRKDPAPCVTYWMNRLQGLASVAPVFVTLNPHREPAPGSVIHREAYAHPLFDAAAMDAQRRLWSL
ncbi:MAG: FAD-dependent oxidoreductase, partial [Alphaproteobacteria bacterium]|nr:FAD-dependent oxidoreductase [Alphaproteobacteria bacterium]